MAILWSKRNAAETHESKSNEVIIVVAVCQFLSTTAVALRLYTRWKFQQLRLGINDWVILGAWLTSLSYDIDVAISTRYGLGKHAWDLPPDIDIITSNKLFYAKQPVFYLCVALTKASIIAFYFNIFPQQSYRRFLWFMMALVILTGLVCSIAGIFQCTPVARAWDASIRGTCFDAPALFFTNAGLNITQDLVLYILPIRILWSIKVPKRQRLALVAVFVVGGFTVIAGIIRLPTLQTAILSKDPTWDHVASALWSSVECNLGIVCACLVHLKPLVAQFGLTILGAYRSYRKSTMDKRSHEQCSSELPSWNQPQGQGNKLKMVAETGFEEGTSFRSEVRRLVPTVGGVPTATATATATSHSDLPTWMQTSRPNEIYMTKQYGVTTE
ncbi:hypothetical protein GGS20DRAFT_486846 [Poronia punctata]|nr:hypothetical protein GGS20DRAFT_486846 [Poronia punctata]